MPVFPDAQPGWHPSRVREVHGGSLPGGVAPLNHRLRAGKPSVSGMVRPSLRREAGGFPACSRWLRSNATTPPDTHAKTKPRIPAGMPAPDAQPGWHPSGVREVHGGSVPGGVASLNRRLQAAKTSASIGGKGGIPSFDSQDLPMDPWPSVGFGQVGGPLSSTAGRAVDPKT